MCLCVETVCTWTWGKFITICAKIFSKHLYYCQRVNHKSGSPEKKGEKKIKEMKETEGCLELKM